MGSNSQLGLSNLTLYLVLSLLILSSGEAFSQTTFTESAAAYGLNLNQSKDGGGMPGLTLTRMAI